MVRQEADHDDKGPTDPAGRLKQAVLDLRQALDDHPNTDEEVNAHDSTR